MAPAKGSTGQAGEAKAADIKPGEPNEGYPMQWDV